MAVENRNRLKLNIKYPFTQVTTVTANDHNVFELEVWDGQARVDLSEDYTYHLVTQVPRQNKHQIEDSFIREAALNDKGRVEAVFGFSETQHEGIVDCTLQIYDQNMKRISTMVFKVKVIGDMTTEGVPATDRSLVVLNEETLNEKIGEALTENIIENIESVVKENIDEIVTEVVGNRFADIETEIDNAKGSYPSLLAKLEQMEGTMGEDGKSAYEIAKENGFVGTEAQWLESLKGEDGVIDSSVLNPITSELNQARGSYQSLDARLNGMILEGGGAPSNVILFEDWTPGESVIIGDTPAPPTDTTPPVLTITQGGNFTGTKSVTMSVNETAVIYYTLDGSNPTVNSAVYFSPLTISATTTLKAFARDTAGNSSAVQTIVYTLVVPEPGDTTPPNNVTNLQVTNNTTGTSLTLNWTASTSSDVAGYEIYRGSTLLTTITSNSYNVTGLTANTEYTFTVKAKDTSNNVASGTSVTVTATYIDNVAPVLTITAGGTFTDTQTVTMSVNETAAIYYTLDGTEPSGSSLVYSTPITLNETTTVKAFAKDTAGNSSAVQTITYTKQSALPSDYVTDSNKVYYNFDYANVVDGQITDLSGNGFNTTVSNFAREKFVDGAIIFNYSSETQLNSANLPVGSIANPNSYPMTYEFYTNIKPPQAVGDHNLFSHWVQGTKGIRTFFRNDNKFYLNGILSQPNTNIDFTNYFNKRIHLVVVFGKSQQKIYIDGVLVLTNTQSASDIADAPLALFGGVNNDCYIFRAYNKELSQSEINQNHNWCMQEVL